MRDRQYYVPHSQAILLRTSVARFVPAIKIDITMTTTTQPNKYGMNEIAQLFPPLMKIKDETLREKVAAVWNEAIMTGCGGKGWTFDELRAVKFTLLAGDIDMTFVEHLNSCALQCIAIADVLENAFRCGIPIQRDYLIAGALLADVGKPLEYAKDASGKVIQGTFGQQVRHPFSGVALAYHHGLPGEVLHIIATHSHEGDKVERSIESIIFHHADFVDFDIAKLLGKRAAKK
jgi:putative nucleotidyltransferase with HDIG domain